LAINHDVAIIGWDDNKVTAAPNKGAWLCKNSWGTDWGINGYFWISYYDKYCCHYNEREWTASFQGVERMPYNHIYYHDYHGWQATLTKHLEAFNAFNSTTNNVLHAVSFFTPTDNEAYTIRIYNSFEGNELKKEWKEPSSRKSEVLCYG
jgi:C1A family cysteine protease